MSRTTRYKLAYFTFVGAGALITISAIAYFHLSGAAILGLVIVLLIPGRILGYFWRDLLRGRRFLNAKQYAESKRYSELFLEQLRARPWIKRLIWLGSGCYSRDPEA